jgi:transposase InsO family protein
VSLVGFNALRVGLPAERVRRALDQTIVLRGKPRQIRCDNGPEYISGQLIEWAEKRKVALYYIQPGKPRQNAYVEPFSRSVLGALHGFKQVLIQPLPVVVIDNVEGPESTSICQAIVHQVHGPHGVDLVRCAEDPAHLALIDASA